MKTFNITTYTRNNEIHYNDLSLDENGNITMSSDLEALKYVIENVVKTQMGELQLNINKGIPYFQTIFSHQTNVPYWKVYMVDAIENVDGVISCEYFNIDIDNEKNLLTYVASIKTEFGDILLNG
jgi:hypothetical protein